MAAADGQGGGRVERRGVCCGDSDWNNIFCIGSVISVRRMESSILLHYSIMHYSILCWFSFPFKQQMYSEFIVSVDLSLELIFGCS